MQMEGEKSVERRRRWIREKAEGFKDGKRRYAAEAGRPTVKKNGLEEGRVESGKVYS